MRKSKLLALVSLVMATALLFTACSSSSSSSSDEKTVLKVQWVGDFSMDSTTDATTGVKTEGLSVLEEEFERLNPDIDLQYVIMGWDDYQKKTQTMIEANEADLFQAPGIAALAALDLLEPLQSYIDESGFDTSVYFDNQIEGWMAMSSTDTELEIYGLPIIADTRVIMYDKQLFDDFGVEYLSANPTIEEIVEKAEQLTGINPVTGEQVYGITWKGADAADTVVNIAESFGATWGSGFRDAELETNFNSDEIIEAVEILADLTAYSHAGVMSDQGNEAWGTESNNIAINLRCGPDVSNFKELGVYDRIGVSYLFINEEEGMGGLFAGSPLVMSANSEVKDEAWTYMEFTATEFFANYMWENQRNQSLPALKSILDNEEVQNDENLQIIFDSLNYLWAPRYPYRASYGRGVLTSAVEEVILNGADSTTTFNALQADMEEWVAMQ